MTVRNQDSTQPAGVFRRLPVRARLALWHTMAVAVVLLLFALATSEHLARTHAERIDGSLSETADLVSQVLRHEAVDEEASLAAAVEAGAREVRYRDRRVAIVDSSGHVLARSDSTPLGTISLGGDALIAHSGLRQLLRAASDSGHSFVSIGTGPALARVHAVRTTYRGTPLTLVVARAADDSDAENHAFMRWLYAMIPVALVVAGGFGYLLVRQSLTPAVAMARQAERIGAAGLDARLEVTNAHDELGELGTVLNQLLSRLQASFGQQRRFMADASHELRTPVAVVRTAADIALHDPAATPDALREALATVQGEGRRMTRIVDDLFLLARADSAQQPVHRERLYLEELVAEAAKAGRLLGRARRVCVVANLAEEAPFDGDATLLMRMLMNLVDNAIKFSPEAATVRLHLQLDSAPASHATRCYRLSVADEGPGVDHDMQFAIFERFARGNRSRGVSTSPGAGLGLAIARWIAEAHGGTLGLETSAPGGAVFVVVLPAPSPGGARTR